MTGYSEFVAWLLKFDEIVFEVPIISFYTKRKLSFCVL